jgi:hypothetical protein
MKKYLLIFPCLVFSNCLISQSFFDDFESYAAGQGVAAGSDVWATPSGANGGSDDLTVTSANTHSGSGALFFTSNVANEGGPAHLLLPLPQTITSGSLTLEWWMSVAPNGNLAAAKIDMWEFDDASSVATQIRFSSNYVWNSGFKLQLLDGVEVNFACDVPTDEWFKMTLLCHMHLDQWEVRINDVSQGVFSNAPAQLSTISFKAYSGDAYYIDDVYYNYEPYAAPDLGLAISAIELSNWANQISQPYYWNRDKMAELAGEEMLPLLQFRNVGNQTITSFDVTLNYNGESLTESITDINLEPFQNWRWQSNSSFIADNQPGYLTATVDNMNGASSQTFSRSLEIIPIVPNEHKKVLFEAATATWCQWCPRSKVTIEDILTRYPEYAAHVSVHQDDPMSSSAFDAAFFFSIPSARVMDYYFCGPEFYLPRFYEEIQEEPTTAIDLETYYDSVNHVIEVVTHTTFLHDANGTYFLKVMLTEDSLSGTTSDWAQMNAFAGGFMGDMAGYESLPYVIPAEDMVYNQVARMVAPSYYPGLENPFENAMLEDSTSTHTFTFELPDGMDPSRVHVTAEVRESNFGVDNIASTMLMEIAEDTTTQVSIEVLPRSLDHLHVYPNPATDRLLCELRLEHAGKVTILILGHDGKCIHEQDAAVWSGPNLLTIPLEGLEAGAYYVQIITEHDIHTRAFLRQ